MDGYTGAIVRFGPEGSPIFRVLDANPSAGTLTLDADPGVLAPGTQVYIQFVTDALIFERGQKVGRVTSGQVFELPGDGGLTLEAQIDGESAPAQLDLQVTTYTRCACGDVPPPPPPASEPIGGNLL